MMVKEVSAEDDLDQMLDVAAPQETSGETKTALEFEGKGLGAFKRAGEAPSDRLVQWWQDKRTPESANQQYAKEVRAHSQGTSIDDDEVRLQAHLHQLQSEAGTSKELTEKAQQMKRDAAGDQMPQKSSFVMTLGIQRNPESPTGVQHASPTGVQHASPTGVQHTNEAANTGGSEAKTEEQMKLRPKADAIKADFAGKKTTLDGNDGEVGKKQVYGAGGDTKDAEVKGKSVTPTEGTYQTAFKKMIDDTKGLYSKALNEVTNEAKDETTPATVVPGMDKHKQYEDFTASVLATHSEKLLDKAVKDAKAAVTGNDKANKDAFEYVDDLEKLATASSTGYNEMALNSFYAHDQIMGQIEQGHMVPGRSIKIFFPLRDNIHFKSNRGGKEQAVELTKESKDYVDGQFSKNITDRLSKYHGMHFTLCFHASTNLKPTDVPISHTGAGVNDCKGKKEGEESCINEGGRQMLTERIAALRKEVVDMIQKNLPKLSDDNFHVPEPEVTAAHFENAGCNDDPCKAIRDKDEKKECYSNCKESEQSNCCNGMMPSGGLIIVAEDRLHKDQYDGKATTDAEVEEEANKAGKNEDMKAHDKQTCSDADFTRMRTLESVSEDATTIAANAPFATGLPQSTREETTEEVDTEERSNWNEDDCKHEKDEVSNKVVAKGNCFSGFLQHIELMCRPKSKTMADSLKAFIESDPTKKSGDWKGNLSEDVDPKCPWPDLYIEVLQELALIENMDDAALQAFNNKHQVNPKAIKVMQSGERADPNKWKVGTGTHGRSSS